jgi:hypothetical protein
MDGGGNEGETLEDVKLTKRPAERQSVLELIGYKIFPAIDPINPPPPEKVARLRGKERRQLLGFEPKANGWLIQPHEVNSKNELKALLKKLRIKNRL